MTTPATTPPVNPLEGFQQIKDKVHVYHPSTPAPSDSTDPGLIVVCSWAFAPLRPLSKYLRGYQALYPHASILLVQNHINNMLFTPDSWQMSVHFNYAAEVVKQYVDTVTSSATATAADGGDDTTTTTTTSSAATPRILLQVYSNGGSHSAVQLAQAYRTQYNAPLPISAIVLDSTPGNPHWRETAAALQTGLPRGGPARLLGALAVQGLLVATTAMHLTSHVIGVGELATVKLYRVLNEPGSAFLRPGVPRTYVHSEADVMILSRDVVAHADVARERMRELLKKNNAVGDEGVEAEAQRLVRVEEFIDTPHANHMSSNPARYWGIVRSTWEASLA